jgi:hypothetical protein
LQGLAVSLIICLIVGIIVGYAVAPKNVSAASNVNVNKKQALFQDMRKLWSDHVIWTREYIVAYEDGSPGAAQAEDRLLKNQEDLGNAIVPYFGKAAGDNLTALLKQHIFISIDLIDAAKSGNQSKYNETNASWYENADELAAFLNSINPNWNKQNMVTMLDDHLSLTTREVFSHLNKDYVGDVKSFDMVYDEIMSMSDALSAGIVKQFPGQF